MKPETYEEQLDRYKAEWSAELDRDLEEGN
jgi:hypothetical protein